MAARLHPLTRFEADPVGGAIELIAHVELRDRWGDSVKGAGVARFVLWESVGAEDGSTLRWEVDLTDLALNAAHYDPSTRTYRFELKGVGAWATSGGVTLSVAYDVVGGNGSIETLRDRAVVGG
ncbi:MAG: hypothetical protein CMJ31_13150 [Phycisphaerae bacterium]|nr:hypothetical protein [Phycisphaerae bacterium]